MQPLKRAYIPDHERREMVEMLARRWLAGEKEVRDTFPSPLRITAFINDECSQPVWKNETYQVSVRTTEGGKVAHLSIKRIDRQPVHDWRDLQAIKNQLVGPECEAVELYPSESRLVDTANQYHLWCITDSTYRFPFGFQGRFVTEQMFGKSVQRPFQSSADC